MNNDKAGANPEPEQKGGWLQLDVHPYVFFISAGIIVGFVILRLIFEANVDDLFSVV